MAIVFHVVFRFAFHLVHLDFGFHVFSHFFPVLSHLDSGVHFVLIVLFIFFFMWISVFISFIAFTCSCRQPFSFFCLSPVFLVSFFHLYVHAVRHVHFSFGFFRCVCPVHCVLVSHCAVLCLFPVCVYVHSNCFFCKKYPNIFPRHFGWGAKQALLMNKIHAMKRHENPDENLFKWKLILAMKKDIFMKNPCKWKWKNEKKMLF